MQSVWRSLASSGDMMYQTFWALVLGFTLSGLVQAYGSRRVIASTLGNHRPMTVARSTFFGVLSSSCSYAASSIAKSLFDKGADFTSSMIFMIASTNLVIDLGLVLWTLLGWQFALAEVVGAVVMIVVLSVCMPRVLGRDLPRHRQPGDAPSDAAASPTLYDAAGFIIGDITMLRSELILGFLVAGMCGQFIPVSFWHGFFFLNHGWLSTVENAVVGPIIAAASFVCSVGNIPLGAALWNKGFSFGGTLSFIYADLLTIPLLIVYTKFYGRRTTVRLAVVFWLAMSVAGLVTQFLFNELGVEAPHTNLNAARLFNPTVVTTTLDVLALLVLAATFMLHRRAKQLKPSTLFALDPICGMQVARATATNSLTIDNVSYYFCCPGCRDTFAKRQGSQHNSPRQ